MKDSIQNAQYLIEQTDFADAEQAARFMREGPNLLRELLDLLGKRTAGELIEARRVAEEVVGHLNSFGTMGAAWAASTENERQALTARVFKTIHTYILGKC